MGGLQGGDDEAAESGTVVFRHTYVIFDCRLTVGLPSELDRSTMQRGKQIFDIRKRKMDILAQRWTKWHENGQFGRDRGVGTEIAILKVKTFKSDLLQQADYCKAATTPTDRKQRKIV